MTRIAVLGGHGKIALLATPLLVAAGHEVVSVVRNPDHVSDVEAAGATAQVADLESLDLAGTTRLLAGFDAVVWSAGAGGGDAERTYAVDRDAAIRTVDAAGEAGARRYVMVSYFGAGPGHGVPPDSSFFAYAEAKTAADAHLSASDLDWTILRPSRLTDEPGRGSLSVGSQQEAASVPRADVAAAIAAVLPDAGTFRRTYELNAGSTPTGEAFA